MPQDDGTTLAEHYESLEGKGIRANEAQLPDLPWISEEVFTWWMDLNKERPSNGYGISPLTSKFMLDYLECYCINPARIELELLKAIDQEFVRAVNDRHSKTGNKGR